MIWKKIWNGLGKDRKGPVGTELDKTGFSLDRIRHDDHVG